MDKERNNRINKIDSSSSGFKIPDDYFDNLENNLIEKVFTNESSDKKKSVNELHLIRANELGSKRKESGFKVPENYFEQLEGRFSKTEEFHTENTKVRRLRLVSMSVAASILLFFGIQYMNKGQQNVNEVILENEEIAGWVDENIITFDSYDIAEAFSDVELEQSLYTDEAVNDYLDFVDIESLIIEN